MPLKKIRDITPQERCIHPDHNFPSMILLSPGVWEHTCPKCGKVTTVTVPARTS
jgi:hypothetical protein